MAWGYEAHFTVEHDNTLKKKIDCKDCMYYEHSDKSCNKRPLYLPEDGYNSWRHCEYFEIDPSTNNYEIKVDQLSHTRISTSKAGTSGKTVQNEKIKNKVKEGNKVFEFTIDKIEGIEKMESVRGLLFNSKTLQEFRIVLNQFYAARHFYSDTKVGQLIQFNHENKKDFDFTKLALHRKQYIEAAVALVPETLSQAFISDDNDKFTLELSKWFTHNGMEQMKEKGYQKYALEIKNIAFTMVVLGNISINQTSKEKKYKDIKILFLDSLTYILIDKGVLHPIEYAPDLSRYRIMR